MASLKLPTLSLLRKLLRYDPATGAFRWRERPAAMFHGFEFNGWKSPEWIAGNWNKRCADKEAAASARKDGYRRIVIHNQKFLAHRIAWKMQHGTEPNELDHINGDRSDNRIANLREVTRAENSKNHARASNNTSGVVGVCWCLSTRRWHARIKVDGKNRFLGSFADIGIAADVRKLAEVAFGFHENHGREPA